VAEALVAADGSLSAALAAGRAALEQAGCDSPRLDAELLLGHVLGVGRERLVLDRDRRLGPGEQAAFADLLGRRAAREPVAYILGRRDFRRLTLAVDRRVLIPRPETELLVEVGLRLPAAVRVLDVGTGSGAVALALKHERPDLVVAGTDLDPGALAVARLNRDRLGLEVQFHRADLLDGAGTADAVLANLPYVSAAAELAPEIAAYEPAAAVFAGSDGLDAVRRLVAQVAVRRPLPLLALEIGSDQAAAVTGLMRSAGLGQVEVRRDLAGHERVVVGRA
jgi:release factor glutamine methyltransferase